MTSADSSLDRDQLERKMREHLEAQARELLAEAGRDYAVKLAERGDRSELALLDIRARDWRDRSRSLADVALEDEAWTVFLAEHEKAVSQAANDLLPAEAARQIGDYQAAARDALTGLRHAAAELELAELIEAGHLARTAGIAGVGDQAERAIATKTARKLAGVLARLLDPGDGAAASRMTAKIMAACAAVERLDHADLVSVTPPVLAMGGAISLDLGTGLAECDRLGDASTRPQIDLVEETSGQATGVAATAVVITGSARDVAVTLRTRRLTGELLLTYARRAAWAAAYDGTPGAVKSAMGMMRGLEIVALADPAISGGLWVEIDPATQEPAATVLIDMRAGDHDLEDFRLLLPGEG